jgi:alkanesulfonate monooxygenase SsuD/methylene tetrahydromethanopterin reductase-like flavin-dependent oxidoreductase (luciferase family)
MKRGIFLAPFDEFADPRLIAELARDAERARFDGFFLWDHVAYREPVEAILDPWVCMAAGVGAEERSPRRPSAC